jgi:hypothetical protein
MTSRHNVRVHELSFSLKHKSLSSPHTHITKKHKDPNSLLRFAHFAKWTRKLKAVVKQAGGKHIHADDTHTDRRARQRMDGVADCLLVSPLLSHERAREEEGGRKEGGDVPLGRG